MKAPYENFAKEHKLIKTNKLLLIFIEDLGRLPSYALFYSETKNSCYSYPTEKVIRDLKRCRNYIMFVECLSQD